MLLFPAGAAPCQGTLATLSHFEDVCCSLSNSPRGDRGDPKGLWGKGDCVMDKCQLPAVGMSKEMVKE